MEGTLLIHVLHIRNGTLLIHMIHRADNGGHRPYTRDAKCGQRMAPFILRECLEQAMESILLTHMMPSGQWVVAS